MKMKLLPPNKYDHVLGDRPVCIANVHVLMHPFDAMVSPTYNDFFFLDI